MPYVIKKKFSLKLFSLILIFIFCWLLGRYFQFDVDVFRSSLEQYPLILSGVIFVFLYVLTTTFIWFGPKDILRISGAILFGGYISTIFVWLAEMINAVVMFQLSRVLGREFVEQKLQAKSGQLDKVKKDVSFLGILTLRVNPLVPFRLMDLGYGLSSVSLKKYWFIVVAASLPRIAWLQIILAGVGENLFKDPKELINYLLEHQNIAFYSGLYFLGVIFLTVITILIKIIRKKV